VFSNIPFFLSSGVAEKKGVPSEGKGGDSGRVIFNN